MKNIEKAILAAIGGSFLAFCLFVMIFGAYANHVEQQERAEREAVRQAVEATRETIPESEKITIPEPEHYFGVEEMEFEEYPKLAVTSYIQLLTGKYGLVEKERDDSLKMIRVFQDPETQREIVEISEHKYRRPDGLIHVAISGSEYCRMEVLEAWDGDISMYLYDPSHWEDCYACGGWGKCRECRGYGMIDTGGGDDTSWSDCKNCVNGECSNKKCYDGKVKK